MRAMHCVGWSLKIFKNRIRLLSFSPQHLFLLVGRRSQALPLLAVLQLSPGTVVQQAPLSSEFPWGDSKAHQTGPDSSLVFLLNISINIRFYFVVLATIDDHDQDL